MVNLKADNRVLTQNAKYAFLTSNYSSGVSTVNVTNTSPYAVDDFILLGEMGQESAEIFRIGSISASGDIVLQTVTGTGGTTLYGHPESSKVYQLPYNQINFYWTATLGTIADETPTFASTTSLSGWVTLDPTSLYTVYSDISHSTGFGWFVYRNSITTEASTNSNAIPYAGFSYQTVSAVFSDFDSLLNVSELKLVSVPEKFSWLNEALTQLKNKLNLSNVEYFVSTPQLISVTSGTAEYQLPDDFSDMVSITDGQNTSTTTGDDIPYLSVAKVSSYRDSVIHYYLRNRYVGIIPTPTTSATYYYRYRGKAVRVTGLNDYIDLPDGAFFTLKDWMLYRAGLKFKNPNASIYLQTFTNSINLYIQASVKRDANLDTWGISASANA